jgi:hypothetical protein
VRDPILERLTRIEAGEQAVDQAGRERIASADPIEDLQIRSLGAHDKFPVRMAQAAPAVHGRGLHPAQARGNQRDVGEVSDDPLEHLSVARGIEVGIRLVDAADLVPERCAQVLLVAEEDIDEADEPAVHFVRALLAPDAGP